MIFARHIKPYIDVTPNQALEFKDTVKVIDVRDQDEYFGDLGHIPGSTLVPTPVLDAVSNSWEAETPILVVCRSGRRSAAAAERLARRGFTRIHNLAGGMLAWNAAGLNACSDRHPGDASTACNTGFAVEREAV
jgi:rhodanese-related sulfurtransferase